MPNVLQQKRYDFRISETYITQYPLCFSNVSFSCLHEVIKNVHCDLYTKKCVFRVQESRKTTFKQTNLIPVPEVT